MQLFIWLCVQKAKQMASFIWIASVKDAKYSLQQLIYNICSMYEKYTFFHFLPLLISYMDISMEIRVATVKSRSQTFILALIKCANSFRRKMINSLRSFYDIFIICIFLVVSSFFSGTALSVSNQMKPFWAWFKWLNNILALHFT